MEYKVSRFDREEAGRIGQWIGDLGSTVFMIGR
jgi:hypothetical protein